jgi:hypothetical protein
MEELYPISDLFAHLHRFEPIGEHFKGLLPDRMMPIEGPFEKNTITLKQGEISTIASWMPVGYARAYVEVPAKQPWKKSPDQETIGFWKAKELIVIKDSFFQRKGSTHFLEIARGSVLRSITYDNLEIMKIKTKETYELIAKILSDDYTKPAERTRFLKMKASERYAAFLEEFDPRIEQYFELRHIASYLGIDPTTLSDLRA